MKKSKAVLTLLATSLFIFGCISSVYASEPETPTVTEETNDGTKGEVTEYHYKYIGDVLYKRLWSVTRNCWIDPYWIPA